MLYAEPARIGATLDDGRAVIQHLEAGMVAYRAVGAGTPPHAITNLGDRPSRHFVVELLDGNEPEGRPPEHNGRGRTEPAEAIGD